jgi:hypothetical protein
MCDDDHEEMQACEAATPDPGSTPGLCAEHESEIMAAVE